jgi:hypothetical protein
MDKVLGHRGKASTVILYIKANVYLCVCVCVCLSVCMFEINSLTP